MSLLKSRDLTSRQVSARIISLAYLTYSRNNTFSARVFSKFIHLIFILPSNLQDRSLDLLLRFGNSDDQASANHYWNKMLLYAVTLELTSQCMHGDEIMRRGTAQIFARNADNPDLDTVCKEQLFKLINDSDEQVRKSVGDCFIYLRLDQFNYWRSFIEEFVKSPFFLDRAEHLIKYLLTVPFDDWDLPLRISRKDSNLSGKRYC